MRRRWPSILHRTLAVLVAAVACSFAGGANPGPPARLHVAGLEQPATVLIDEWGVPHIYAGRLYDAFVAQGFAAARDRLWQIDLWRKRGLGELAKDLGPAYVESDRMARSVLFRGSMYREWLAYGSDAKRIAEAFVAGINAYVALTESRPEMLPEEFRILGSRPARWAPADVVRIRHHGLTLNLGAELTRAEIYCKAGAEAARADWLHRALSPQVQPTVADGLDVCAIPVAALREAYARATSPPRFPKASTLAGGDGPLPSQLIATDDDDGAASLGSNNWVIGPARSETGRPVLASDPHRLHGAPSLRHLVHLTAPGLNVIGAGEPFLPGISIGHNDTIAFGITRFYMDQEDLYVYETNPARPDEYRYQDRWEPMETVTETIEVRGEKPRSIAIHFTRHGPVFATDAAKNRAYALRAAWLDVGMSPYFGSIEYMRAQNWDQFRAAMNRWGAPGENHVYADRHGNIGWVAAGLTVVRPNWDGLTPVPGDGRYEWTGYRDMDELPWAYNPPAGYIVTANENTIPPDHPAARKGIGYEWSDPSRSLRLRELFSSKTRYAIADSLAWQHDTTSPPARRVVRLLEGLTSGNVRVVRAIEMLKAWDGDLTSTSAAGAIFETWFTKHLRPAVVHAVLRPEAAAIVRDGDADRVIELLEGHRAWLTRERRDHVLLQSLEAALVELDERLGRDMRTWQWGGLHRAVFDHPLSQRVDAETRRRLSVGAWPLGGSLFTPMMTSYRATDFQLLGGASFRMVADVGNWDASQAINAPGQSGDPASPHYRDLAPLWAKGGYFPLVFSRDQVERRTRERIELVPTGETTSR
jgi:penicillin amidase